MCAGQLGHGAAVPSTPARHRRAHPALDACLASAAGTGTPAEPGRDALQQARTGPDPVAVGTTASTALTFLAMQKIPKFRAASPNLAFFFFFLCQFFSKNSRQQWALCCCVCVRSQTQCCALLRGHSAPACAQAPHKHRTGVPGAAPRAPCPHSHFPSPADAHPGTPQHPAPPVPATWYLFV